MPRLASTVAALLATVLLVGGCAAAVGRESGSASTLTATASLPPKADGATTPSADEQLVRDLFVTRVHGLETGDLSTWLEGVTGRDFVEQQRQVFERMRALHVSRMQVVGVRLLGPTAATPHASARRLAVRLNYRFAGFDTSTRSFTLEVTMADGPDPTPGPSLVAAHPADRPQPWDLPDPQVRRTGSLLVISAGSTSRPDGVVRPAEAAMARVSAVLGRARPAVLVAPDTDELAASLLGRSTSDLQGVAAVTDGPLDPTGRAGADRIVIVPEAWSTLSPAGRQVVLAHELTHVTTRATEPQQQVPIWLSEGLAEYVAYHDVRLPERVITAPGLDEVRSDGVPTQWPTDAQFGPSGGRLSAAYALALLACRTIADDHGQRALLRLYHAAAIAPMTEAFAAVGLTEPADLRAWRQRITRLESAAGQE